jgi:hypothetical protein
MVSGAFPQHGTLIVECERPPCNVYLYGRIKRCAVGGSHPENASVVLCRVRNVLFINTNVETYFGPIENPKRNYFEVSSDAMRACMASKIMLRIALSRLSSFFIIDFSLPASMRRRVAPSTPAFAVVLG